MKNTLDKMRELLKRGEMCFPWLLSIAAAILVFIETEICDYNSKFVQMSGKNILMNTAIIFCVFLIIYGVSGRWWCSIGLVGVLFSVICIINIYSIQFRRTPVSARDLFNARSAMNVLSSYEITWGKRTTWALATGIVLCLMSFFCFRIERKKKYSWKAHGIKAVVSIAASVAFFQVCCFGSHAVKPANISALRYEEGYQVYGFMQVSAEVFQKAAYKIERPEGYTAEAVRELAGSLQGEEIQQKAQERCPDIIFIINESWYDLTQVADLNTDTEVMPYMSSMGNIIQRYVVVPDIAHGTNLSEYEALTGNSLQLMQGITPFQSLNMEGASSIVSCLEEQGYETAAFHSESRDTYNRIIAYPAMGFDRYYFIDDFDEWDYWEQRTEYVTDESNFKNMLEIYDSMPEDTPRFLYDLTTQNHGDYLMNNYKLSTVHIKEDLGDEWMGYRINEYLSCVKLTDEAFHYLIGELEARQRPVLVCMVGDHAPAFTEAVADRELSPEEMDMKLRSTPCVIWSNFELNDVELPEYIGLSYLPSVLLKLGGGTDVPLLYLYG